VKHNKHNKIRIDSKERSRAKPKVQVHKVF
jgi:hypothetical protein